MNYPACSMILIIPFTFIKVVQNAKVIQLIPCSCKSGNNSNADIAAMKIQVILGRAKKKDF